MNLTLGQVCRHFGFPHAAQALSNVPLDPYREAAWAAFARHGTFIGARGEVIQAATTLRPRSYADAA